MKFKHISGREEMSTYRKMIMVEAVIMAWDAEQEGVLW